MLSFLMKKQNVLQTVFSVIYRKWCLFLTGSILKKCMEVAFRGARQKCTTLYDGSGDSLNIVLLNDKCKSILLCM